MLTRWHHRKHRAATALVTMHVALLVAAACGARVTPEQVAAARQQAVAGPSGDAGATAGPVTSAPADTGDRGAAATADAPQGAASSPGPVARATDNGGATDVGVTADTMNLGLVTTLSGPVPGVFQGAAVGMLAAVAHQNAEGGMFGRRVKLDVRDDALDSGKHRAETIELIGKVFALVGTFSSYDDAAAPQIEKSGIPDVGVALTTTRRSLSNNFSILPYPKPGAPTGPFNYFKGKFPDAVQSVGSIYYDIAKANQDDVKAAAESVGWHFTYNRGIQATETDFTADVVWMRQAGVKAVYLSAVDVKAVARLAKAMAQQNFKPQFTLVGGVAYDAAMLSLGGDAVDGFFNVQSFALFAGEDAGTIPEVRLFDEWINKVKPGYKPDLFAAYGWASGRLFFQALQAAGPKATRADVVRELKKITDFSANGFVAPAGPGPKKPATCFLIVQIKGGKFARFDSPPIGYRCGDGDFFARA